MKERRQTRSVLSLATLLTLCVRIKVYFARGMPQKFTLSLILGLVSLLALAVYLRNSNLFNPCMQPLALHSTAGVSGMQQQSQQEVDLLKGYVSFNYSLTAALHSLKPSQLTAVLRAWQQHKCATLLLHGYTPTINGKAARRASTKSGVSMYVYPGQDIVSDELANPKMRAWEQHEIRQVTYALNKQLPYGPARSSGSSSSSTGNLPAPLFVDIGANVGVFTLNIAKLGARVYAFEGLSDNLQLLQASLCINPHLQQRVTLFPLGLSSKNDTCWVVSDNGNVGDGFTMCGYHTSAEAQAAAKQGYTVRSSMLVRRLDDLVQEDIKVLKMDVEGHEYNILQGANQLLKQRRVWFILAEANQDIIGREGAYKLVTLLQSHGYRISTKGFRGPWVSDAQVQKQSVKWRGVNVYAAHQELFG